MRALAPVTDRKCLASSRRSFSVSLRFSAARLSSSASASASTSASEATGAYALTANGSIVPERPSDDSHAFF
eukprot:4228755-Pleurochrysis_carterae.AAC.1